MSIHPSLAIKGKKGAGHRNVFKKYERVIKSQELDVWKPEDGAFKMPKLRSIKIKKKKAVAKAKA